MMRRRALLPTGTALLTAAVGAAVLSTGCLGARFQPQTPGDDVDAPTRAVLKIISDARAAKKVQPPTWVSELRPPALRGARGLAAGDLSPKTAARQAALGAVTELGRHVWSFLAECTDLAKFRPPSVAVDSRTLLLGAAVVSAPGGRSIVILTIAEPGTSALRADQMGGGGGGTNPTLESYAHPVVASAPCGEGWPAPPSAGF
jgi:hypothetical protein